MHWQSQKLWTSCAPSEVQVAKSQVRSVFILIVNESKLPDLLSTINSFTDSSMIDNAGVVWWTKNKLNKPSRNNLKSIRLEFILYETLDQTWNFVEARFGHHNRTKGFPTIPHRRLRRNYFLVSQFFPFGCCGSGWYSISHNPQIPGTCGLVGWPVTGVSPESTGCPKPAKDNAGLMRNLESKGSSV